MLIGLAALAALPARAAPAVIAPGEGIGPARLGMSPAQLAQALGGAGVARGARLAFPRWGLTVTLDAGAASVISTTSTRFRTSHGAGVGTPLAEVTRLVGDPNSSWTEAGNEVRVVFPFQGLGFVFRAGTAVEVFVERPIALSPQPGREAPGAPALPPPGPPPAPGPQAPPGGGAAKPAAGPLLRVEGVQEVIDPGPAVLRVTGRAVNGGASPLAPVTVTARFRDAGGLETVSEIAIRQPVAPGAAAPFTLQMTLARSVVVRYTLAAAAPGARAAEVTRTIAADAYAALARAHIRVTAALGGPSNTGPMVQVLVSIADAGPIPRAWIRDVSVEVPYTGGQQVAQVTPERPSTVLVPATAQLGTPQIRAVTLQGP